MLFIDERKKNTLFEIDDALENNEAKYQLIEGFFYDFEFSDKSFHFKKDQIVQPHSRNRHVGTISPNIYVGTLSLPVFHNKKESGNVRLEVQSVKAGYRDDYRDMLELITEKCTDLLLQANSPVSHYFETDFTKDYQTLYQKFIFIRSIIGKFKLISEPSKLQLFFCFMLIIFNNNINIRILINILPLV